VLVRELMATDPARVQATSPLMAAVRVLADRGVSALPVVDDEGRVVGILSEADVLRLQITEDPRAHLAGIPDPPPWPRTVETVMTPEPVCALVGSDVSTVAMMMADTGWKSLPVVDDHDRLVGMVSRSEVIRALSTSDTEIRRRLVHEFEQLGRREWTVRVQDGVVSVLGAASARDAALARAVAATAPGVRRVEVGDMASPG
jgi:CBS domain-containing protein